MSTTIAVIDDEPAIVELVSLHLTKAHFKTCEYYSGSDFLSALPHQIPDLVILDLSLPDKDGLEICRFLKSSKKYASIPVIILTVRNNEEERILGFELGADDYVTKPFSPRELILRVKAILRRELKNAPPANVRKKVIIRNVLEIDPVKHEVRVNGKHIELTPTEFRILNLLCERRGYVLSREQILDHLWSGEKVVVDRTVDVHIKNLRKKIKRAKKFIKNIRGIGYKFDT